MVGRAPRFVTQFALSAVFFFYLAPDLPLLSAVPRIRLVGDFPEPEPVGWGDFSLFPLGVMIRG